MSDAEDFDGAGAFDGLSRRHMLGLMGVGAAAAIAPAMAMDSAEAVPPPQPKGDVLAAHAGLHGKPNFLVIVVDEMRSAPIYETAETAAWRARNLKNINSLSQHGYTFNNHHIMSAACAPSRTSFFTGQYPSLHGVSQTSGAAKNAVEEDLYWLDPTTVPTMGHYFRAAGYDTFYKGKWHVSDADLYQPGSYDPLPSYKANGNPNANLERIYLEADRLDAYGFTGWVGPEPHGSSPLNSGSSGPGGEGRDQVYAQQGVRKLRQLKNSSKPWLLVTSFVNPHDITIWGDLALASRNYYLAQSLVGSTVPHNLFDNRYDVSANEDLSGKPAAQESYKNVYADAFQPTENNEAYRRFYYQLQANVDKQIGKVLNVLKSGGTNFNNTVVIFLSDHGELLGSHGGMFQKWHQAYDEVLRVPFVFHNPSLFPQAHQSDVLTSHADLLPTMLGLAGVNLASVRRKLRKTHTQVRNFPGRNLAPLLKGKRQASHYRQPQYFMSDDEPTRGSVQLAFTGQMYRPVVQPCHLETVVAWLPTGAGGASEQWKYTRYFDNPQFWSNPNVEDVQNFTTGKNNTATPPDKVTTTTVKTTPVPDEIEVYNVTTDPTEQNDLASDSAVAGTVNQLAALLAQQRAAKRLVPLTLNRDPGIRGGIGV